MLSEITQAKGVGPTVARAALASRTTDGVVDLDEEEEIPVADPSTVETLHRLLAGLPAEAGGQS